MNVSTRRTDLSDIKPMTDAHAGLWLDKFIFNLDGKGGQEKRDTPKTALVKEVARISVPKVYEEFYERWVAGLVSLEAKTGTATVGGRLAIGLGDEAVLETSVKLHRTYGIPYIPGSALKGLAASYARNRVCEAWEKDKSAYNIAFGKMEQAGYITFHDALYVPGSANGQPLRADVIAVHHPAYYRNEAGAAPADWDDPNPVPFLSATGDYLIALSTIPGCELWLDPVWRILELALEHEGVGAKTSSGYGRLKVLESVTTAKD